MNKHGLNTSDWLPIGVPLDKNPKQIPVITLSVRDEAHPYGELLLTACTHTGENNQSLHSLLKHLYMLQQMPNMRAVHLGDFIDPTQLCAGRRSVDIFAITELLNMGFQMIEPVAGKFVAVTRGEMDQRIDNMMKPGTNYLKLGFSKMKSPAIVTRENEGLLLMVEVRGRDDTPSRYYPLYIIHSQTGAFINEYLFIKRIFSNYMAPVIASAHVHRIQKRLMTLTAPIKDDNGVWHAATGKVTMVLVGGFIKQRPRDDTKGSTINTIGAPILRFMRDRSAIEVIPNPSAHSPEFFRDPCPFHPNTNFRIEDHEWPFRSARRKVPIQP